MGRHVTYMTIGDAEHYTPERRKEIIDSYPAHERDARAKGIPVLGSGAVFPVPDEDLLIDPMPIPDHWVLINGMDFGWDHPFGAAGCAWDRDADIFYIIREYSQREATPLIHSGAVKPWGDWIPWSWPHDGLQHDKGSGHELATQYRGHGLMMLADKATFPDGSNGVEAGIFEMLERMQTGRWKVFRTCGGWMAEKRLYHRKDGLIVKLKDDVISASRYAYMMRRFAKTKPQQRRPERRAATPNSGGAWMGH